MAELVIVAVIIVSAIWILSRRFFESFGKDDKNVCGGCTGCSLEDECGGSTER